MRKAVQELFAVNLESQRKEINALIVERFDKIRDQQSKVMSQEELVKRDAKLAAKLQKQEDDAKRKKKRKTDKPKKKRKVSENANSIQARKVLLSKKLEQFLGETELPRTQVVKKVWDYIKEHELQNPNDRREILCDDAMEPIFGKKMTMFSMNKILSKHLFNPEDVVNGSKEKEDLQEVVEGDEKEKEKEKEENADE